MVDWSKVNRPPYKKMSESMKKLENCNYVVDVAKQLEFSVVGTGGKDILDMNKKLVLGLLYQTMRAYTLQVLQKCTGSDKKIKDEEIVAWVNEKLTKSGKDSRVTCFKDPTISNGKSVIDLIDSIKPGVIKYNIMANPRVCRKNAKKAIDHPAFKKKGLGSFDNQGINNKIPANR